jgi:hypothetical protein
MATMTMAVMMIVYSVNVIAWLILIMGGEKGT